MTIAVLAGAVVTTWLMVALLVRFAPRIGLMDRPNERSLHKKVTPRGGGVGFVLVATAVAAWMVLSGEISDGMRTPLAVYWAASLFIAAVSLRDDFKSLSSGLRLLCQIAAALAATISAGSFHTIALPGLGGFELGWGGAPLTVIWIVGLTNVYNFMDGVDGIAGVQGVVASLAWGAAGLWMGSPSVALLGAAMAGGCLGFLLHNWSPAKIFMGDVGSAYLGYSFAVLPLLALREIPVARAGELSGSMLPFAALVVWPFIGDGLLTFIRRAVRGETVWKPHRSHLYQRLAQSGWTHAQVSALYAGWCVASGMMAAGWGLSRGSWPVLSGAGLFALISLGAMLAFVTGREVRRRGGHA